MQQTIPTRVTTMDQLYATAAKMQAPVLIHVDGVVEWCNRSFQERFGIKRESLGQIKIGELLWVLGILPAISGMVTEGLGFRHCAVPSANSSESTLMLKQVALPSQIDGRKHLLLVLADEFDPEPAEICIGDH
jgi:hypothetical protein